METQSLKMQTVLGRLEGIRKNGTGYMAKCPAHADRNPSLSIREGVKGIVLYCHAGCSVNSVLESIDLSPSDLFYDGKATIPDVTLRYASKHDGKGNHWYDEGFHETRYEIRDRAGKLIAEHVRREWSDKPKLFRWFRDGEWNLGDLSTKALPLYRVELLPDNPKGVNIYLTEGEKACDVLIDQGRHAVATVCGANTIPNDDILYQLLGWKQVYLWPDADDPGRKHMEMITKRLWIVGIEPKLIQIPNAKKGDDAADYFAEESRE